MKTQHTPGPWKVNEHSEVTFKDGRICDVDYYNVGRGEKGRYQLPHEANARLIAAAPELLDALSECLEQLEQLHYLYEGEFSERIQDADDAAKNAWKLIAKFANQ